MRKPIIGLGVLILAFAAGGRAQAQGHAQIQTDCLPDVLCITRTQASRSIIFQIENLSPSAITVRFDVSGENVAAPVQFPYVHAFDGGDREIAFVLLPGSGGDSFAYTYTYRVAHGRLGAQHDDQYIYALPYAPGTSHRVIQGYNGSFSHQDIYAIDWEMPEGTPVRAARSGYVVAVCDSLTEGGVDRQLEEKANYVMIAHDDGTVANYAHLQPEEVAVAVGDRVRRGQVIGQSGNTGYSAGPHLHFEVYRVGRDLDVQTLPVRFAVEGKGALVLEKGRQYTAPLPGKGGSIGVP